MDLNVYQPFASLLKSPVKVGGLCSLSCFPIEDVLEWPERDPLTGICATAIQMKPGKSIHLVQAADAGRSYKEQLRYDALGPYMDTQVQGIIGGHSTGNILSLMTGQYHQWGLIANDRNGNYRLIGNKDSGAEMTYAYDSGDAKNPRKVALEFRWQPAQPAPIYNAQAFQISIGGVRITAGSITLVQRFKVGQPGAPMADGDDVYTNAAIAGKNVLVIAGGMALSVEDGSASIEWVDGVTGAVIRHVEKLLASDTITFIGAAVEGEIIEIYTIQ